jgi:deoxyribodipyrimidine photolyase-related protein
MKSLTLIFPHQLFRQHPGLQKDAHVLLVEDYLFFRQFRFHKQKIMFHRASMRAYADMLRTKGYHVSYLESSELTSPEDVYAWIAKHAYTDIHIADPVDDWLMRALNQAEKKYAFTVYQYESPGFLNTQGHIKEFFHNQKRILMHDFYVWQRKRLGILCDEHNRPLGGKWSFDHENRKKLPRDISLPLIPKASKNLWLAEAYTYTETYFGENYGKNDVPLYSVTHTDARRTLKTFIAERLSLFGPYEDALSTQGRVLFHSVLSPLLNVGLLTPQEVIDAVLDVDTTVIPLQSQEGFIRQIIGWREFMRAMYLLYGKRMRSKNFFHHTKKIPKQFWEGTTGIMPLDHVLSSVIETAYAHHIERLMILGNWMLLSEYHPDEVYEWFMTMFIDAYDWVMVPNVYGMSQFADGGIFATKPYISGSNYIKKMSDFPKGDWTEVWDKLFWDFLKNNRDFFARQPRMQILLKRLPK